MRDKLKNKKIWWGVIITMFVFLAIVAEVAEVNAQGPAFPLTPGSGHTSNTLNFITWDWAFIEPTDITACSYPGLYYEIWDMYFNEVIYDTRSSPIPCVSNWTETGLSANELYDRCVKACDASGCSGFSTTCELSGAGIAYTSIETPTGISCSEISSSSIKVTALGNFTNLLGNASGIEFRIAIPVMTSGFIHATSYTFNYLDPDTTYSVYVRSQNGDGDDSPLVGPKECSTLTAGNTSGYAWGENIGWISFDGPNSTNLYQVKIDPGSGIFSGYAWSESLGSINFNSAGPPKYYAETTWRGINTPPTSI